MRFHLRKRVYSIGSCMGSIGASARLTQEVLSPVQIRCISSLERKGGFGKCGGLKEHCALSVFRRAGFQTRTHAKEYTEKRGSSVPG